jgi:hypothetical protein
MECFIFYFYLINTLDTYNMVKPRFIVFIRGPEKNDGYGKTMQGPIKSK